MKIKLLTALSSGKNAGDVIDVTNDEAARMIEAGQATPVTDTQIEKATIAPKGKEKR